MISQQGGGLHNSGSITIRNGNVVGGNLTINDPEALIDAFEKRGLLESAKVAGLQRRIVVMLAQRLKPEEELDFEQAIVELGYAVEVALEVIKRGAHSTNEDEFIGAVLAEASTKTRDNDLDGAAQAVDDALIEFDEKEVAQRRAWQSRRIELLEAAIRQHTLRRDAVTVSEKIEQLVGTVQQVERPTWHSLFQEHYSKYLEDGKTKGINFPLEVAVECSRRMVAAARGASEHNMAAFLLAAALAPLGERENGSVRLKEAIDTYRFVLQNLALKHAPTEWATTQNNLGVALTVLGQREADTALLKQAIEAHRSALQVRTREHAPFHWAMSQHNLGNAFSALGIREGGTLRLKWAVKAYYDALQEWTQENAPRDWALTQSALGSTLCTLGEKKNSVAWLQKAVDACHNALQEWTQESVPLSWALAQNNLGNALSALGERGTGTVRLLEAVTAYRNALQERRRERVPLEWAKTQYNLGITFCVIGERESGTTYLEAAIGAYRNALQERTPERNPYDWNITQRSLDYAQDVLTKRLRKT